MRKKGEPFVHGRGCYARPCELGADCEARKAEAREYQAKRRAALAAKRAAEGRPPKLSIVRSKPAEDASAPAGTAPERPETDSNERRQGTVAAAAAREIDGIPGARADHPLAVALIESLAHLIDVGEPKERVTAAREIAKMMTELRPAKAPEPVKDARAELIAALAMPLEDAVGAR